MKALGLALALAVVLAVTSYADSAGSRCNSGEALAFIAIQDDPLYIVGTIPGRFTDEARFFSRRYNCRGQSAQVRRVDLGVYEVRFPGLHPRAVVATAISEEAVSVSVHAFGDTVRVALRGPLGGSDVAARRDVAFSLAVF